MLIAYSVAHEYLAFSFSQSLHSSKRIFPLEFVNSDVVSSFNVFQLATLEFPPKKLFGNKDDRVIAERRSHLEVTPTF